MANMKPLHRIVQWALLALLLTAPPRFAEPLSPAARGEIEVLLSRLAESGCQFLRNGNWYPAGEAQVHLRRKLDYLVDKGAVASAEDFIERAASQSSMSGQVYQVKCGHGAPVASGPWLRAELQKVRAGAYRSGPNRAD